VSLSASERGAGQADDRRIWVVKLTEQHIEGFVGAQKGYVGGSGKDDAGRRIFEERQCQVRS
jgi:hypothetical protein